MVNGYWLTLRLKGKVGRKNNGKRKGRRPVRLQIEKENAQNLDSNAKERNPSIRR